nr:unnamed protein product [Spirometra erinaceieuropaei]
MPIGSSMSAKKSSKSSINSDERGNAVFARNFSHQCEENGLSSIPVLKFKQIILPEKTPRKNNKKESTRKTATSIQPGTVDSDDSSDPKTFKIVDNLHFQQPCVELWQKTQGSPDTVQEIRIRGWKCDEDIYTQLKPLFLNFKGLHTLIFWNAGLTSQMIINIGFFVAESKKILKVEANNLIEPETYHELIPPENSSLVHLSLRFTKLSAEGIHEVAIRLGNRTKWNNSIVSLDLTGCGLTDLGMCYLAEALRTNRRLKFLTLANNQIGDLGVMALCETITKFFLTDDELALRRILQGEYAARATTRSPVASKRVPREKNKNLQQRRPTREFGNIKGLGETITREQILDSLESKHPLLAAGENIPPHGLRIHGNYEVSMINLAHNKITVEGLKRLTDMLQIQMERRSTTRGETLTGITRLVLSGNNFDESVEEAEQLRHLLRERTEDLWSTDVSETASAND